MPENRRATRLPSSSEARPLWARALDTFYGPSFDLRSRKDLAESMADFLELPPGEQAFHQAHLAFRQTQGLADVHASLRRVEALLGGLDLSGLGALKHLAPMRRALEDIADAQSEVLDALEDQGGGEDQDVLDDEAPPDGDEDVIEDDMPEADAEEEPVTWDAPGEEGAPEVVVPEIVDAPRPRRPKRGLPTPDDPLTSAGPVIDVPSSEAA